VNNLDTTLELVFLDSDGKTVRLSVNDPKEDLNAETIKDAMEQIIAANIFETSSGASLVSVKEARKVQRAVEVFELE